jgi:hypothetical protein
MLLLVPPALLFEKIGTLQDTRRIGWAFIAGSGGGHCCTQIEAIAFDLLEDCSVVLEDVSRGAMAILVVRK